MVQQAWRGTW